MRTVGEVFNKFKDVRAMIDKIYIIDNSVDLGFDKDELIEMLDEYCALLCSIRVTTNV